VSVESKTQTWLELPSPEYLYKAHCQVEETDHAEDDERRQHVEEGNLRVAWFNDGSGNGYDLIIKDGMALLLALDHESSWNTDIEDTIWANVPDEIIALKEHSRFAVLDDAVYASMVMWSLDLCTWNINNEMVHNTRYDDGGRGYLFSELVDVHSHRAM
jgi:hypothetical protein